MPYNVYCGQNTVHSHATHQHFDTFLTKLQPRQNNDDVKRSLAQELLKFGTLAKQMCHSFYDATILIHIIICRSIFITHSQGRFIVIVLPILQSRTRTVWRLVTTRRRFSSHTYYKQVIKHGGTRATVIISSKVPKDTRLDTIKCTNCIKWNQLAGSDCAAALQV